jgi:hypothetical protein
VEFERGFFNETIGKSFHGAWLEVYGVEEFAEEGDVISWKGVVWDVIIGRGVRFKDS